MPKASRRNLQVPHRMGECMSRRIRRAVCLLLVACACAAGPKPRPQSAVTGLPATSDRKSILKRILPQNVRLVVFAGGEARRSASGVVIGSEATADGSFSYVLTSAHAVEPYGKSLSISGGLVSQVEWDRKSRLPAMLKTDAPIGYGASGGGVYSASSGRLLAIVEGYRTARVGFAVAEQTYSFDVPMPGETFAAPSAKVRAFLENNGFGRFVSRTGPAAEATQAALR